MKKSNNIYKEYRNTGTIKGIVMNIHFFYKWSKALTAILVALLLFPFNVSAAHIDIFTSYNKLKPPEDSDIDNHLDAELAEKHQSEWVYSTESEIEGEDQIGRAYGEKTIFPSGQKPDNSRYPRKVRDESIFSTDYSITKEEKKTTGISDAPAIFGKRTLFGQNKKKGSDNVNAKNARKATKKQEEDVYKYPDNVHVVLDEKVRLRYDNVHYTNPDVDKESVESLVVISILKDRNGNIVTDAKDAEMGIPYITASYTTEREAGRSTRFNTLGTPYTIRTKTQEEFIRRGGY